MSPAWKCDEHRVVQSAAAAADDPAHQCGWIGDDLARDQSGVRFGDVGEFECRGVDAGHADAFHDERSHEAHSGRSNWKAFLPLESVLKKFGGDVQAARRRTSSGFASAGAPTHAAEAAALPGKD